MKITLADALAQLPLPATETWKLGVWDAEVMKHGTMTVEIFAPKEQDYQSTHEQDELYFIVSGRGDFWLNGETMPFAPGDAIFVPARVEHCFTTFTPDFVTWVVFYGPVGGEKEN
jgi:mannose-6-phosphate isomerase-like protein (cupin superfamily)